MKKDYKTKAKDEKQITGIVPIRASRACSVLMIVIGERRDVRPS